VERKIIFTNDLDGVHFIAPLPLKPLFGLIRGDLSLPPVGRPIEKFYPKHDLAGRLSVFDHQIRPFKSGSLEGLTLFRQAAQRHSRELDFAVLSGRQPDKHQMTIQRLQQSPRNKYFSNFFLNEGDSATTWKETIVSHLVESGSNVVHIDDDLRAGICIARVNLLYPGESRVLVYVLRNLSNHPILLRHSKIELPPNLFLVNSFKSAATDFDESLEQRKI